MDDLIQRVAANDGKLTSLCVLTSTRTVTTASCIDLSQALKNNTTLTELLLSGHSVGTEGITALSEALSGPTGNTTLLKLCIGSQQFSDAGASALATHLGTWNTLQDLDLELKNLSATGVADLGLSLASNTSLTSLALSRNPLTDQGIDQFLHNTFIGNTTAAATTPSTTPTTASTTTTDHQCRLETLSLVETGCGPLVLEKCATICCSDEYKDNTLKTLNLNRNADIGNHSASLVLLPTLVRGNCRLQELYLSRCDLNDQCLQSFCQGLSTNAKLLKLDLSKNTFGADGAHSLAMAFQTQSLLVANGRGGAPHLQTLTLNGNDIGSSGAIALANALSSVHNATRCVQFLNLQSCRIGAEGAAAVGLHLHGLIELNVMDCNLGDEGVLQLVKSFTLETHNTLRNLNLCANEVTDVGGVAACTAMEDLFPIELLGGGGLPSRFILGLGANNGLGSDTSRAAEQLLVGRNGFQVAMDIGGDEEQGEKVDEADCDESKFNQMLAKFPPSKFNGGAKGT